MSLFQEKLLQASGILPNLYYIYKYEIYDVKSSIGFKVKNRCLLLSKRQKFRIVNSYELPEQNSGIFTVSGHHLFQTAIEVLQERPLSSPANCLISKLRQESFTLKIWFLFLWYNFCSLITIFSLPAMLNSKKMPTCKKFPYKSFLDNFKGTYFLLCETDAIHKRLKPMCYKISYFITEWRHYGIVIHGKKHAFVLELSCRKFRNGIYNCPKIRYLPSYDNLNMNYIATINRSADYFVRLAISTVQDMPKYNLLKNNCQNFVKNFLESVDREGNELEGEKACKILEWLDSKPLQDITYIMLGFLYIFYDEIPDAFLPSTNSFIVVSSLFLLLLITYHYLHGKTDTYKELILLTSLMVILYSYSKKSIAIFHGFFLMLCLFIIRLLRLRRQSIALTFLLLALFLGFVSYEFFSKPFLSSVAIVVYTIGFGIWSAVGNTLDHDLTVILPCIVVMTCYNVSNNLLFWIIIAVLYFMQLKDYNKQSFLECALVVITLLIREFCISKTSKNTHSTHLILVFIMFIYTLVKIVYKYIAFSSN